MTTSIAIEYTHQTTKQRRCYSRCNSSTQCEKEKDLFSPTILATKRRKYLAQIKNLSKTQTP